LSVKTSATNRTFSNELVFIDLKRFADSGINLVECPDCGRKLLEGLPLLWYTSRCWEEWKSGWNNADRRKVRWEDYLFTP
jgi:hypothetical protein